MDKEAALTKDDLPLLRERVRAILKDELALAGFSEDPEGDFSFNYERTSFEVIFDPADSSFVWIRDSVPYWISGADDMSQTDSCINEVNRTCKLVKMFRSAKANRDGYYAVVASASILVDDTEKLSADTLERCLFQIKVGRREFFQLIHDEPHSPESERGSAIVQAPVSH